MFEDDYENDSDVEQAGLSEQAQRQLAKERRLIEDLETDAAEHPFEEDTEEKEPERKKLRRELQAEALARLEDAARTQRILKMSSHGGTGWTLTGSAGNAIMNSAAAETIFRWNTERQ